MKEVQVHDKLFREFITEEAIEKRIEELAERINNDYKGKELLFLGILNGAFMFAAALLKRVSLNARITFVKLASYDGANSSGTVKELIGWNEDITGKEVIILEDIVDTGNTLEKITEELLKRKVAHVRIATLLLKPGCYTKNIDIDYVGFNVPNDFVIGYGLDYSGYGRNLASLYSLVK